jgi:ankyrin repeat protein
VSPCYPRKYQEAQECARDEYASYIGQPWFVYRSKGPPHGSIFGLNFYSYLVDMDKKFTLKNKMARTFLFRRSRKKQLVNAILRNDARLVSALLHDGVDVNFLFNHTYDRNVHEFNPLLLSIYMRNVEIVKLLLERDDIQVNNGTRDLDFPLINAVTNKMPDIVRLLLGKRGIDPNITGKGGGIPAFICSFHPYTSIEILKLLIETDGFDINKKNASGRTLLMEVLIRRNNRHQREIVELLLENNVNLFITYEPLITAIELLKYVKDKEIEALIMSKVEYELNNPGADLMVYYILRNNIEKVKLILEKDGFDVNKEDINGRIPLLEATYMNHIEIIKLLLEKENIDINKHNKDFDTPLMFAIVKKNTEIAKLLLEKENIDFNKQNTSGTTPLMLSIDRGNTEIAKLLLEKENIDVNKQHTTGLSSLMHAIYTVDRHEKNIEIVNLLLEKPGININIQTDNKTTAITYAIRHNLHLLVKKLLDMGADITMIDNLKSRTLLIIAAKESRQPATDIILKLLLDKKQININAKDKLGKNALDYYTTKNGTDQDIIDALTGPDERWQGFTKGDMELMDKIFVTNEVNGKIPAADVSLCPICLSYAERIDGCMYMSHNCITVNKYYDKELHAKYKHPDGTTRWCTCCGRIAHGHTHYTLALSSAPKPSLGETGNYFGNDCTNKGGGGLVEKLSRITEYRNMALSLNDQIGKISYANAYKILIRAVWDAPLTNGVPKNLKKPADWNEQTKQFPNMIKQVVARNAPDIAPPPYLIMPIVEMGNDDLIGETMMIKFDHKQKDGENKQHEIPLEDFILFIKTLSTAADNFGYCIFYNRGCNSCLHPQEVLHISERDPSLTKAQYERYKKFFNEKFNNKKSPCELEQEGGANEQENIIKYAHDAVCLLPPKKGGKRKMKTRSKSRKIKNTRKKRY